MAFLSFEIEHCDGTEFVLMPACAYNGNRFPVLKKEYPPMFTPEEASVDMPSYITDVPRLESDGTGRIEVTTGDLAVPCVGVFLPGRKQAVFVFTVQSLDGQNIGIAYERGTVELTWPARRTFLYRWPHMVPNPEPWHNQPAEIPAKILRVECENLSEFYRIFFENRKCMGMDDERPDVMPRAEQKRILIKKYNRENWFADQEFYGTVTTSDPSGRWFQAGWIGGGMLSYALLKIGGTQEQLRARKTLRFMLGMQHESGLFWGGFTDNGLENVDGFGIPGTEFWTSIRKNSDILYYLIKHLALLDPAETLFSAAEESARKLAQVLTEIWHTHGQMGQFADIRTGKLVVGNSAAGALAAGALASAAQSFGRQDWLQAASEIGEWLYDTFTARGYSNGGPNEILQCPDSESAIALLESYAALYQVTRKQRWLDAARDAAHQLSSWVVAYNYAFPAGSEFARLGMKTVGAVFANVQNKHAAPGLCTFSGVSIRRLYYWTGDARYLELYLDVTQTMAQYISTEERPIYSWSVPKDATANSQNDVTVDSMPLNSGYVCERVNMSDWETEKCVGGVFNASCTWCEINSLLMLADDCNIEAH